MKNGLIMDHLKTEPCDNTSEGTKKLTAGMVSGVAEMMERVYKV
jgi:hypothetical protein